MKKKKSQELSITTIIVAVIALIVLFILVGIFTGNLHFTEQGFCSYHPDKCVLEPTLEFLESREVPLSGSKEEYCLNHPFKDIPKRYCKYRRKTPQELEIEYCNKNPEDEERCVCEEREKTKEPYYVNISLKTEDVYRGAEYWFDREMREKAVSYDECEISPPSRFKGYPQDCLGGFIFRGMNYNYCIQTKQILIPTKYDGDKIIEFELKEIIDDSNCKPIIYKLKFYDFSPNKCTKANPKTECEKGNPDWVEEELEGVKVCFRITKKENITLCNPRLSDIMICDWETVEIERTIRTNCTQEYETICREKSIKEKCIQRCEE